MFAPRASKRETINKSDYIIDYFHSHTRNNQTWNQDYLQFCSIDPGTSNFGVRIERRYHQGDNKGKITSLLFERIRPKKVEDKHYRSIYSSITEYLEQHIDKLLECHIFIIERQMAINYQSVRVQQHVQSYLMTRLKDTPRLPLILEIDAKGKCHFLGCPKGMNKTAYKKWSVKMALELLYRRNDMEAYQKLEKASKKDDLADIVCMIEAICEMFGLMLTPEIQTINTNNVELEIYPGWSYGETSNMSNEIQPVVEFILNTN